MVCTTLGSLFCHLFNFLCSILLTHSVQDNSAGRVPWLGWLRVGMFHHPAWAVGSYKSGPPAGGTPQIYKSTQPRYLTTRVILYVLRLKNHLKSYYTCRRWTPDNQPNTDYSSSCSRDDPSASRSTGNSSALTSTSEEASVEQWRDSCSEDEHFLFVNNISQIVVRRPSWTTISEILKCELFMQ